MADGVDAYGITLEAVQHLSCQMHAVCLPKTVRLEIGAEMKLTASPLLPAFFLPFFLPSWPHSSSPSACNMTFACIFGEGRKQSARPRQSIGGKWKEMASNTQRADMMQMATAPAISPSQLAFKLDYPVGNKLQGRVPYISRSIRLKWSPRSRFRALLPSLFQTLRVIFEPRIDPAHKLKPAVLPG